MIMTLDTKSARFLQKALKGNRRSSEPFLEDLEHTIFETGRFIQETFGVDALKKVIDFVGATGPDRKPAKNEESQFGTREEILQHWEELNVLENTADLPDKHSVFLMPDGQFFCCYKKTHKETVEKLNRKKEFYPNGEPRDISASQYMDCLVTAGVIRISRDSQNRLNRLDMTIVTKVTPQQLKTIHRVMKDDPTIWLTWQIGDNNHALVSGEGHQEMLADLRKYGFV